MNREDYIEKLIKLAYKKWGLTKVEEEEMRLLLDMIPDRPLLNLEGVKFPTPSPWPDPNSPVVVMYGCGIPFASYGSKSELDNKNNLPKSEEK